MGTAGGSRRLRCIPIGRIDQPMIAGRRMTFLHGAQRDIIDRTGSTPRGGQGPASPHRHFLQGVESRGWSRHIADRTGPSFRADRGPVRGPGRRMLPAPRVPSMRWPVQSLQLAGLRLGSMPLVMRRWLVSGRRLRFVVAACWRAEGASRRWVMSHTTFVSVVSRSLPSRG